jgi:hypothetical protein
MWMQLLMGPSKYIVGISGTVSGYSFVRIAWPEEIQYAAVIGFEDITSDLASDSRPMVIHGRSFVELRYSRALDNMMRHFRMSFGSGESFHVNIIIPPGLLEQAGQRLVLNVKGQESGTGYSALLVQDGGLDLTPSTYAMFPVQDPSSRFREKVWTQSEQGTLVSVSSENLKEVYNGFGTPAETTIELQHASVLVAVGAELTSSSDVLDHIMDGNSAAVITIWSKDLRDLPKGNIRTFEVCSDRFSLDWYRTTGNDSYGNAIPQEYLDGVLPAKFVSSGCVSWSNLNPVALPRITRDGSSSIEVAVISSSITPTDDPWTELSEYRAAKSPAFTALSSQDFKFTIIEPDGSTSTSGVITDDAYAFSGLAWSDIPYLIRVEEDLTGNVVEMAILVRNPVKDRVTSTGLAGISNAVPVRTPFGEDPYQEPLTPECICNDNSAINFTAGAGPIDPCGICFECINGNLTKGGVPTDTNLIKNTGSFTTGSSFGNSDGTLVFIGAPAIQAPDITPFLPTTFEIDLYSVPTSGALPSGAATAVNAHHQPSYTFTGLAGGWYMVNVYHTGLTCNSRYWFFIAEQEIPTACNTDVDINIDPCTRILNGTFEATDVLSYNWFLDGDIVQLPVQVSPGQTVSLGMKFTNGCEDFHWTYLVTATDLDCPIIEQWPTGCTDPIALNFDPTATIDAGTCIYGVRGCMDSSASNFDPQATVHDQSMCLYLCSEPITPQDVESAVWFSPSTGLTVIPDDPNSFPDLPDGAYLVTVTTFNGCIEVTPVTINTPLVFGCMDPLADNFLPAANLPVENWVDGLGELATDPCTYRVLGNPCIPKDLQDHLTLIDRCLKKSLDLYFARLKGGMLSPCFEKDLKTAALIRSVLHRRGLECLFNCKDSSTPDSPGPSCSDRWKRGGPTGEELVFDATVQYTFNDIVLHPDGFYYVYSSQLQVISDPLTYHIDNPWKRCTEPRILHGDNLLDGYLSFIRKFCLDCGISPSSTTVNQVENITDPSASVDGEPVTINGNRLIL